MKILGKNFPNKLVVIFFAVFGVAVFFFPVAAHAQGQINFGVNSATYRMYIPGGATALIGTNYYIFFFFNAQNTSIPSDLSTLTTTGGWTYVTYRNFGVSLGSGRVLTGGDPYSVTGTLEGQTLRFLGVVTPSAWGTDWTSVSANISAQTPSSPYTYGWFWNDNTLGGVGLPPNWASGGYGGQVLQGNIISSKYCLEWTIKASAGANGTISPNTMVGVPNTGSQGYTISPNSGYAVSDVLVDGASQGAITSYTFSNVTANHTISATFVVSAPSNTAPSITAGPSDGGSSTSSLTAQGSNVAFTGTGTDIDGDNYYLAICKTDAISANNSASPTCTGGNWCISSSTASGSGASCNYTTSASDAGSHAWYAFVCDYDASSACSSSSQGSDTTGSPFVVDSTPVPSSISVSSQGVKVGTTLTFSGAWSDSDSGDNVKMYICKDSACTNCSNSSQANCWCNSSDWKTGEGSDSCTYQTQSSDIGNRNFWLSACDDQSACGLLFGGNLNVATTSFGYIKITNGKSIVFHNKTIYIKCL